MCEPVTVATAGIALAGAGVQAWGQYQAGEYEAEQAKANSLLAGRAAADAAQRGEQAAGRVAAQAGRVVGAQRAALAAGGVDVSAGGIPDQLESSTRAAAALDAATVRNNAVREAWGYQAQASQMLAGGEMAKTRSRYAVGGTLLGAAGTLLGIGSQGGLFKSNPSVSQAAGDAAFDRGY